MIQGINQPLSEGTRGEITIWAGCSIIVRHAPSSEASDTGDHWRQDIELDGPLIWSGNTCFPMDPIPISAKGKTPIDFHGWNRMPPQFIPM